MKKYKIANKTLDIIRQLTVAAKEKDREQAIAKVLSIAFMRSVMIYGRKQIVQSYDGENVDFFKSEHELATVAWVKRNGKMAGNGTSTLRESKGLYFPMENEHGTIAIGFSCQVNKMTVTDALIFSEISNVLRVLF